MSITEQAVLDQLARVVSPKDVPLTQTGTLSQISVTDGKVFFSISVDAAEAPAWESVRVAAEKAVRAMPGVVSVLAVLTAERKPGAGAAPARPTVVA
ncbi:MAG: iron-sulfur cluster assembly protein, partial [Xanthobacteraceae bacterium]